MTTKADSSYVSRFIVFDGPVEAEKELYQLLDIAQKDICLWGDECAFLGARRNGAVVCTVKGDFRISIDLYLFEKDEQELHRCLAKIAVGNIRIAMPDEESDAPWVFLLWERGAKQRIRVVDDDDAYVISARL